MTNVNIVISRGVIAGRLYACLNVWAICSATEGSITYRLCYRA